MDDMMNRQRQVSSERKKSPKSPAITDFVQKKISSFKIYLSELKVIIIFTAFFYHLCNITKQFLHLLKTQ